VRWELWWLFREWLNSSDHFVVDIVVVVVVVDVVVVDVVVEYMLLMSRDTVLFWGLLAKRSTNGAGGVFTMAVVGNDLSRRTTMRILTRFIKLTVRHVCQHRLHRGAVGDTTPRRCPRFSIRHNLCGTCMRMDQQQKLLLNRTLTLIGCIRCATLIRALRLGMLGSPIGSTPPWIRSHRVWMGKLSCR